MNRERANELLARLRRDLPALEALDEPWWLVGGTVRDAMLGVETDDFDLVVKDPAEAASRFSRALKGKTVSLGREFVVYRVVTPGMSADFAPCEGESIAQDLARRDFTVNAMAIGHDGTFVDPFDGEADLAAKLLRAVAEKNFVDDPLRVLRAARFRSTLDFEIDGLTEEWCRLYAPSLRDVADERIAQELNAGLDAGLPSRFAATVHSLGIDSILFGTSIAPGTVPVDASPNVAMGLMIWDADPERQTRLASIRTRGSGFREMYALARLVAGSPASSVAIPVHVAGRSAAREAKTLLGVRGLDAAAASIERLISTDGFFEQKQLLDGREVMSILDLEPGPLVGRASAEVFAEQLEGRVKEREAAIRWLEENRDRLVEPLPGR